MRSPRLHSTWLAACTAAMLAVNAPAVFAAAPSTSRSVQDRDRQDRDRQEQRERRQFDDHDRQMVHDWYDGHRRDLPAGLRDRDRLSGEYRNRIVTGGTIDRDLRRHVYAVPDDLRRRLRPVRGGEQYVFIDGQLCLVDRDYRILDVLRMDWR